MIIAKNKYPKFRANDEEYGILKEKAKLKNMSLSDYLRALAFGDDSHIEVMPNSFNADSELKDVYISFRVSPDEKRVIDEKAKKSIMTRSQYVSFSALEKDIFVFDGLKEFSFHLSKIGTNLNQIAMLANQGKVTVVDIESVRKEVSKIWEALSKLTSKPKKMKKEV